MIPDGNAIVHDTKMANVGEYMTLQKVFKISLTVNRLCVWCWD